MKSGRGEYTCNLRPLGGGKSFFDLEQEGKVFARKLSSPFIAPEALPENKWLNMGKFIVKSVSPRGS